MGLRVTPMRLQLKDFGAGPLRIGCWIRESSVFGGNVPYSAGHLGVRGVVGRGDSLVRDWQ